MVRMYRGNVEIVVMDHMVAKKLQKGFEILEEKHGTESNLLSMKVDELKSLAKANGIKGASAMNRDTLLDALKDVV